MEQQTQQARLPALTDDETSILYGIIRGLTMREICFANMHLHLSSAKRARAELYRKFDVHTATQLVIKAKELGL